MKVNNLNVKLMATLWENTYRAMLTNENDQYVATARIVVNLPLPEDQVPEGAPEVQPQLLVLVEDGDLKADELIEFETIAAAKIRDKFKNSIANVFFYYPSPEDALNNPPNVQ